MINFNGVTLKNNEKDLMIKEIEKLNKFYVNEPIVDVRVSVINDYCIVTIRTTYCNKGIYISVKGSNKVATCKKAVDDVIRRIRKIKTDVDNKKSVLPINNREWRLKEKEKLPYITEKAYLYNADFLAATEIMEGDGLDIVIFSCNSTLNVLTKTDDGYKVYVVD